MTTICPQFYYIILGWHTPIAKKAHMLSPETEKALAALDRSFSVPYNIYNTLKLADIAFEPFTVNGKDYPLSYSLFEDDYELEADADVRRAAFKAFTSLM